MEYADVDAEDMELVNVRPLIWQQPEEPVSKDIIQMLFMLGLLIAVAIARGL